MPHDTIREFLTDIDTENRSRSSDTRFLSGYRDGYDQIPAVRPHIDSFAYQSYFDGWWAGYSDSMFDGRFD